MARPKNTLKSVQITLSTTEQVKAVLKALTNTGMYGKNEADTAQRLMLERIRELQRDRLAPMPDFEASFAEEDPDREES